MKKMKNNVFFSLAVRMIGFGLSVGIFFPFFSAFFGIDTAIAYSPKFIVACVFAGILVGVINFILVKSTAGKKLTVLTQKMSYVKERVIAYDFSDTDQICSIETCLIDEVSEDEFGDCTDAFNVMVKSLVRTLRFQNQHRVFVEHLSRDLDLETLTDYALKFLMAFSDSVAGAILVEKEGQLVNASSFGIEDADELTKSPMMLEVLKTSKSKLINFPNNIVLDGLLTKFRPVQIALQPILFLHSASGIIVLASNKKMDKESLEQIDIFVNDFALVLNNSLQHEQIQILAALDPLTGIYNRRFGMTRLNEEYLRASRGKSPIAVMMLDIDKFKKINDTYGHIAGDRYLKHIVSVIDPILRNGDFLVRYGGEEFLAVLPGANKHDVFKIAERIRFGVSESSIIFGESSIRATVSIGVDSFPESKGEESTNLIANADISLYEAKNGGRNRTVTFESNNDD